MRWHRIDIFGGVLTSPLSDAFEAVSGDPASATVGAETPADCSAPIPPIKTNASILAEAKTDPSHALVSFSQPPLPRLIAKAGDHTKRRFLEFFAARIRNKHTRRSYFRAIGDFLSWCDAAGIKSLQEMSTLHVAAYVEQMTHELSAPSVKAQFATIRVFFKWLEKGHIILGNPALSVSGPRHTVRVGKTPALVADEVRELLSTIDTTTHTGLRDRALIGTMVYTFGRISAVLGMNVEDIFVQNRRHWVRLLEKGGKPHAMPCHHNLEAYLQEYIERSGIAAEPKSALFRGVFRKGPQRDLVSSHRLRQNEAHAMIRRRTKAIGIKTLIGNHSFRASGITSYLKNGGMLERAKAMANHASISTTQLYDRRAEEFTLDEIERILLDP
jgi:integrase/recombinase XerC